MWNTETHFCLDYIRGTYCSQQPIFKLCIVSIDAILLNLNKQLCKISGVAL